jgi:hypothetical protein
MQRNPLVHRSGRGLIHAGEQHVVGMEAKVDRRDGTKRGKQKSGADDQRQRHGELRHDERLAGRQHPSPTPFERSARVGLERSARRDAGRAPGGGEAERQSRRDRNARAEREHPIVERQVEENRIARRREKADQCARSPACDHQPEQRAPDRQRDAFSQELTDDAPAAGADRYADGHLTLPRGGPGQEQIGNVGARDHEHERGDHHERDERRFVLLPYE